MVSQSGHCGNSPDTPADDASSEDGGTDWPTKSINMIVPIDVYKRQVEEIGSLVVGGLDLLGILRHLRDFPAKLAIRVRANTETEKYSAGPNFRAKLAMIGETNTRIRICLLYTSCTSLRLHKTERTISSRFSC